MKFEDRFIPKPEKPPVLYHASRSPHVAVFEPRAEKTRDEDEGPRVFATQSKALATVFLVDSDDSWVQSGMKDDQPYIIISDEARYRQLDTGGYIYSLPSDSFENDPDKGLREFEWTSAKSVEPVNVEEVPSALDAMLQAGVQVYFVDRETYQRIVHAPDHGEAIVNTLVPSS